MQNPCRLGARGGARDARAAQGGRSRTAVRRSGRQHRPRNLARNVLLDEGLAPGEPEMPRIARSSSAPEQNASTYAGSFRE